MGAITGTLAVDTEFAGDYKVIVVSATVASASDTITLTAAAHGGVGAACAAPVADAHSGYPECLELALLVEVDCNAPVFPRHAARLPVPVPIPFACLFGIVPVRTWYQTLVLQIIGRGFLRTTAPIAARYLATSTEGSRWLALAARRRQTV